MSIFLLFCVNMERTVIHLSVNSSFTLNAKRTGPLFLINVLISIFFYHIFIIQLLVYLLCSSFNLLLMLFGVNANSASFMFTCLDKLRMYILQHSFPQYSSKAISYSPLCSLSFSLQQKCFTNINAVTNYLQSVQPFFSLDGTFLPMKLSTSCTDVSY